MLPSLFVSVFDPVCFRDRIALFVIAAGCELFLVFPCLDFSQVVVVDPGDIQGNVLISCGSYRRRSVVSRAVITILLHSVVC